MKILTVIALLLISSGCSYNGYNYVSEPRMRIQNITGQTTGYVSQSGKITNITGQVQGYVGR